LEDACGEWLAHSATAAVSKINRISDFIGDVLNQWYGFAVQYPFLAGQTRPNPDGRKKGEKQSGVVRSRKAKRDF
jgi:hypothetical protein